MLVLKKSGERVLEMDNDSKQLDSVERLSEQEAGDQRLFFFFFFSSLIILLLPADLNPPRLKMRFSSRVQSEAHGTS